MTTNRLRSHGREPFWRVFVRRWRSSRLAVRAFCQSRQGSEPSLSAWRRTLAERGAAPVHTALIRSTEAGFPMIGNYPAEREMKRIAIGRTNWLFVGSDGGGTI